VSFVYSIKLSCSPVAELATNSGGGRKKNLTSKLKLGQGGYGNGTVYKGKLLNKLIVQ
jgi:hypothetical protein